ncbi:MULTISPECIES: proteasome subunit alpha [unclassified Amycolatopsis]|uniref:proteasome subunit alpha n=1 Tax=unclassified Amycolatopsis TaxID=2618356 RepID=UPI0028764793|nr:MULTISPECIES: proteasome subunit alpha [unclassified Amycolatopsis]MDS0136955.1 proteasome subunit alpha [Amycolatopsis sp. 505]MDS0143620.1 proteasome subunit alpha [Amycolatopsis sp. CM201R]
MTMPLYASPEQLMRERSELARKGIARGRSVVVLKYSGGVLFVAENPSATLHKVSEIYDRIGFAAVGRYSEFENLRVAGIRHADLKGYQYDRRDVSARALANAYAATLGSIFTEQLKPFEVEICVAEVGASSAEDQLYRLTYDGSIFDEPQYVVMGGQTDKISAKLKETFEDGLDLQAALGVAVAALRTPSQPTSGSSSSSSAANASANGNGEADPIKLEVAVLDRDRPRRMFRRLTGAALDTLLPVPDPQGEEPESKPEGE